MEKFKRCKGCEKTKLVSKFFKTRRWYYPYCKECHKKQWKILSAKYRADWKKFFKKIYGEHPKCEICEKVLNWHGKKNEVVHFDHKTGLELIQPPPQQWIGWHSCSKKWQKIWLSCNFGLLCDACNTSLKTLNRKEWLVKVIHYVFKNRSV